MRRAPVTPALTRPPAATRPVARLRRLPGSLLGLLLVVSAAVVAVAGPAPTASAAPSCTRLWVGGSGDWDNRLNWSPNDSAPTSSDVACISSGQPSLDSGNNHIIGAIVLGGPGNPTLRVAETNNVTLMIVDQLVVQSGATLRIGGPTTNGTSVSSSFGATASFVNDGTITLDRPPTNNDPWQTPSNSWSISGTNNGTFALRSGRTDLPAQFVNNGTYSAAANTVTWIGNNGSNKLFDNAGTVTNNGTIHVSSTEWRQRGTTTGNKIVLRDQSLFNDITGAGNFLLWTVHFKGTIAANQNVDLGFGDGGAQVTVDAPSTIAAGATVTANLDGNGYQLTGETLTNKGTLRINALPASNRFNVNGPFLNDTSGTVEVATGGANINAAFTNNGTLRTKPGTFLWAQAATTKPFTQRGVIDNDGDFQASGTTWNQAGGSVGGDNLVVLRDNTVVSDSGGTGSLQLQAVRFTGTVPSGQTLHVGGGQGGQQVTFDAASTVARGGRIVTAIDGNGYRLTGATLTNHGAIDVSSRPGEYRVLEVRNPLVNAADGVITIHTGRLDTYADGLVNQGLVSIDPGAQLGVNQAEGKLVNGATGTLRFDLAAADNHGAILGWGQGRVVPGGTITGRPVGGYSPALGTAFPVIQAPHDAGTFTATAGYRVGYAADRITLTRSGPVVSVVRHATRQVATGPARVAKNARVTLRTVLTDAATRKGLKGQRVSLWRQTKTTSGVRWVRITTVTAGANGVASAVVRVGAKTTYRWTYAGATLVATTPDRITRTVLGASTSRTVTVKIRQR